MQEKIVTRTDNYIVLEGCPTRPYVQLEVPRNAGPIHSLELSIKSRDQGFADAGKDQISKTWHDVVIQRPPDYPGRSHINPIRFYRNPVAVAEFGHCVRRWDRDNSEPFYVAWLSSILPGDTIQIVPSAFSQAWNNLLCEARIKIEFEEETEIEGKKTHAKGREPRYATVLDSSNMQIRLLVIEPGAFGDPIVCRFEMTSLLDANASSPPEFWALSYCWGEPGLSEMLTVGLEDNTTEQFIFSDNVIQAIRRLRSPSLPIRLWIDALCINQQDLVEQVGQVSIMNSIYKGAQEVHIWLGEEGSAIKSALRIIRDIQNITHSASNDSATCAGGFQCTCPPGWKHLVDRDAFFAAKVQPRPEDPTEVPGWYMNRVFQSHQKKHFSDWGYYGPEIKGNDYGLAVLMSDLFGNPWFWRVWVIQEATLARHAVTHCGEEMVMWKDLMEVNRWLDSRQYKFAFWERQYQPQVQMPVIWKSLDRTDGHDEDGKSSSPPVLSLLDVFLDALDLNATKPCDKLYALLPFGHETQAMGRDLPPELWPDYRKPDNQVYADFTRWWIQKYNSLAILSKIHTQPTRTWNRMLGDSDVHIGASIPLPSWTISPHGRRRFVHSNLKDQFPVFAAGWTTVPNGPLLDDKTEPLVLKVTGYPLGSILEKGYPSMITGATGCCVLTAPTKKDIQNPYTSIVRFNTGVELAVRGLKNSVREDVENNKGKKPADNVEGEEEEEEEMPTHFNLDSESSSDSDDSTSIEKQSYSSPSTSQTQNPGLDRVFETMLDPCQVNSFERGVSTSQEDIKRDDHGTWLRKGDAKFWLTKYVDHLTTHLAYFPDETKKLPVLRRKVRIRDGSMEVHVRKAYSSLIPSCLSDCLFIGTDGSIGLCPWTAKEGDLAVLLHGAPVPYLLRPAGDRYQLVGECFVEGAMDGKLMQRKLRTMEIPETFVLV